MAKQKMPVLGSRVSLRIEQSLAALLADLASSKAQVTKSQGSLPASVASQLTRVLGHKAFSYRDGIIIQLAFRLEGGPTTDLTKRPAGGRAVAARLGSLFAATHIEGVNDAYQNIAKNSVELCRGNQPDFDAFLQWANGADEDQLLAAFDLAMATTALTARPVLPMPELDRKALTFYGVSQMLEELLSVPSGGAHQQFAVAAFLHAVVEEFGLGGPGGLRVETKSINAADASSKVAGDIQVLRGNRLEEAFEVTANKWATKVESAARAIKDGDLQRVHILAESNGPLGADGSALLDGNSDDITVIDVMALLRTITAIMRKPARDAALLRLYEMLDRYQPSTDRVNDYVRLLSKHGLTALGPSEPS